MKTTEAIMEILAAYDLTQSYRDAAALAGCAHHTVARYVLSARCWRAENDARAAQSTDRPVSRKDRRVG